MQQAAVTSSSRPKKKKKKKIRVQPPVNTGPPVFAPSHAAPVLRNTVPATPMTDSSVQNHGRNPNKLWCYNCRTDDHLSKDCTVTRYHYICNNYKHPLHRCSVLKQPRPVASFGGVGLNEATFVHLPDLVFKEHLAPHSSPIGLVTIYGDSVTATIVETEITKIASVLTPWKWEAVPHGNEAFLVAFPSMEVLQRMTAFEFKSQIS